MGVRSIPGYYCSSPLLLHGRLADVFIVDKEKNKYFKIKPNGGAPANTAYSSQDVKKRKVREVRAAARELAVARQQGRIKRSKLLAEPLCGGLLARENGQVKLDTAQILAREFLPQGRMVTLSQFRNRGYSAPVFDLVYRPDLGPSASDIYIGESSSLATCVHYEDVSGFLPVLLFSSCNSNLRRN